MSKPDEFPIRLKLDFNGRIYIPFYKPLLAHVSEGDRYRVRVSRSKTGLTIYIDAADPNMAASVSNTIMQSIKMLKEINSYE